MGTRSEHRQAGTIIRYDRNALDPVEPRLFDPEWLKAEGHHRGSSMGRHPAHFFNFAGQDMVLRAFRRGGLIAKINRDLYMGTRLDSSRSIREFELLRWMHARGLPVPEPVAARMQAIGPCYRAAIITRRIPDARPLEEHLRAAPLTQANWQTVGAVIHDLHANEVYHSDLNCRNILIDDENRVWLIDFDKCARRRSGGWAAQNLARLKRSLIKQAGKAPGLHWTKADWTALTRGYATGKAMEP